MSFSSSDTLHTGYIKFSVTEKELSCGIVVVHRRKRHLHTRRPQNSKSSVKKWFKI